MPRADLHRTKAAKNWLLFLLLLLLVVCVCGITMVRIGAMSDKVPADAIVKRI